VIAFPLFAFSGVDLTVLNSSESISRMLEAPDIEDGEYLVFDQEGRQIILGVNHSFLHGDEIKVVEIKEETLALLLQKLRHALPFKTQNIAKCTIEIMTDEEILQLANSFAE